MPTLKQLTCNLEWTGSGTPLTEYQTAYSDGFVETFVAVPSIPTPFSVRLRSHGYIAPGLAMFVYMDGQYQCNRNRRNLRMPDGTSSRKHTEINFHVRQKEDMLEDGTFIGKEWRFEKLNVGRSPNSIFGRMTRSNVAFSVSGDAQQLSHKAPHDAEHVGMIEVVVLRCHPISKELATGKMCESQPESLSKKPTGAANSGKTAKAATPPTPSDDSSTSSESSGPFLGMFDGAGDEAPNEFNGMAFGGDAGWDNPIPQASNGTQQWGASMTSPNRGAHPPAAEGPGSAAGRVIDPQWHGRDQSRHHFKQDWSQSGRPSSQTSQSRNSPQLQQQGSSGSFSGDKAANRSISGSKRTAPSNAGRAAGLGTTVPVTPAVIIDITQADPQPGIWGLTSAVPAASEVDSWATRQTPYDYGQEDGQARQEAVQARQPNDSWQAPTAWSEGGGNGQPSEDKKELSNESAGGNSLAIPQTSNKADNAGNQGPVRITVLSKQLMLGASLTSSRKIRLGILQIQVLSPPRVVGPVQAMETLPVTAELGKAIRETAGILSLRVKACQELGGLMMIQSPTILLAGERTRPMVHRRTKARVEKATKLLMPPETKTRAEHMVQLSSTPVSKIGVVKRNAHPVAGGITTIQILRIGPGARIRRLTLVAISRRTRPVPVR